MRLRGNAPLPSSQPLEPPETAALGRRWEFLPPARIPANEVAARSRAAFDRPMRRRGSRRGHHAIRITMKLTVHPLRAPACLLAAAAASLCAAPVSAQTPTLKETRVTATRFSEPEA